jgi:hypothetical protein
MSFATSSLHNGVAVLMGSRKGMVEMEEFRYRVLGKEDQDPK